MFKYVKIKTVTPRTLKTCYEAYYVTPDGIPHKVGVCNKQIQEMKQFLTSRIKGILKKKQLKINQLEESIKQERKKLEMWQNSLLEIVEGEL